jgi:hypothetical protein
MLARERLLLAGEPENMVETAKTGDNMKILGNTGLSGCVYLRSMAPSTVSSNYTVAAGLTYKTERA